jgi:hypothetical protein
MSEVLAYATTFLEERFDWRRDLGRLLIEGKVPVYLSRQIENRLEQRTSWGERLARVVGEFPARFHTIGTENKLVRVKTVLAMVADQ